jgi:hypothetical protein
MKATPNRFIDSFEELYEDGTVVPALQAADTMTYPITGSPSSPRRNASCCRGTEILASSIMLITISENAKVDDVGYRPLSLVSSRGDIAGWGTEESRTSYKRDLAELGRHSSTEVCTKHRKITERLNQATPCNEVSEGWGFFDNA